MMTYTEAKALRQRHEDALRNLMRTRRAELAEQLAERDRADGRTRLLWRPTTKEELVRELLDLDYTREQLNETTHVLYHPPSTRWDGCVHCAGKPETETVNTADLRPGDVVLAHGMRVRIDNIREYVPSGAGPGQRAWTCQGTVLNLEEVHDQRIVPPQFLETYGYSDGWTVLRRDAWTVQGNTLARHIVELPRPAAARPEPMRLDGCTCEPVAGSHRPGCAWAAR